MTVTISQRAFEAFVLVTAGVFSAAGFLLFIIALAVS